MRRYFKPFILVFTGMLCLSNSAFSQVDSAARDDDDDFSRYENLSFADQAAKRFCTSKILDLSPQKLISIGVDFQGPHNMQLDSLYDHDGNLWSLPVERRLGHTRGLRVAASIPVISKNAVIWTLGGYYWENIYQQKQQIGIPPFPHEMDRWLKQGIRTTALNTTIFKPVNEQSFWLLQAQAEVNGDYGWRNVGTAAKHARWSGAVLYGKKPHDRLQWAIGAVQTWRAGEVNYIPALLYNYTWPSRKYGTEVLFPARAALRRTFNPRNLLFLGYELEGGSYRFQQAESLGFIGSNGFELRRSELRFRMVYECSLKGFVWMSIQTGVRLNYSYQVDQGNFYRGFFGKQTYLMENALTPAPYFQVSLNLVSP
jgi:hypothetical protein